MSERKLSDSEVESLGLHRKLSDDEVAHLGLEGPPPRDFSERPDATPNERITSTHAVEHDPGAFRAGVESIGYHLPFGNEIAALVDAGLLKMNGSPEDFLENYRQLKQLGQRNQADIETAHPIANRVGQGISIASQMALPVARIGSGLSGALASGAANAGLWGAAGGLENSKADLTSGKLEDWKQGGWDTTKGAVTAIPFGLGLGAGGYAAGKASGAVSKYLASKLDSARQGAIEAAEKLAAKQSPSVQNLGRASVAEAYAEPLDRGAMGVGEEITQGGVTQGARPSPGGGLVQSKTPPAQNFARFSEDGEDEFRKSVMPRESLGNVPHEDIVTKADYMSHLYDMANGNAPQPSAGSPVIGAIQGAWKGAGKAALPSFMGGHGKAGMTTGALVGAVKGAYGALNPLERAQAIRAAASTHEVVSRYIGGLMTSGARVGEEKLGEESVDSDYRPSVSESAKAQGWSAHQAHGGSGTDPRHP